MNHREKEGVVVSRTTWIETPQSQMSVEDVVEYLGASGALAEAEAVWARLDDGTETSPVLSPAEVKARLAKYCQH